jgi:O-antigen/teichoic acid export membrane protein
VVQVGSVFTVTALGKGGPASYLWAWGLSGCLAGAIGAKAAGLWPAPQHVWHWLRSHSNITRYSVTELVVINGANHQLTLVLVAALGGLSVVGTLRGGQILTAPTTVLALSTMAFVIPELARRPAIMGRQLIRMGLTISAAVTALVVVLGAGLLLIPESVGRLLLGEAWAGTATILVPTVIGMLAGVISLGACSGVYARAGVGVRIRSCLLVGRSTASPA